MNLRILNVINGIFIWSKMVSEECRKQNALDRFYEKLSLVLADRDVPKAWKVALMGQGFVPESRPQSTKKQ